MKVSNIIISNVYKFTLSVMAPKLPYSDYL